MKNPAGRRRCLALVASMSLISSAFGLTPADLRTGDILLVPLNCYLCTLIEREENSPFSHSGVYLSNGTVLESLHGTSATELQTFLARAEGPVLALRPREFAAHAEDSDRSQEFTRELQNLFEQRFAGLQFDPEMLWDNLDSNDREKLYCSEFVAKFLNQVLKKPFSPKPMHFDRPHWDTYFRTGAPRGLPGMSPADFERSSLVLPLGSLN